ncbi:hypothetical protein C6503_00075 [Candidatus Poribacteria bacterium]|nr:MAG: hypothetical protein C6503_00075 [Candidatus Poribacteria bacterium]
MQRPANLEGLLVEEMEENTDFQDHLWNTAENLINQYGMIFSSDCEFLIRSFIHEGISRMDAEDCLSDDMSCELAEANLAVFVSRMVIIALMQDSRELDTDTFYAAESGFAVWPFYGG